MRRRSPALTALLAVIALFLLPAISNIEANALPASWAPYLWITWPAGVLLSAPLVYLEIRQRHDPRPESDHGAASADEQLRLLATASQRQWVAAANDRRLMHPAPLPVRWGRATVSVAGPVSATSGYARFDPLPGLTAVCDGDLGEGTQDGLHRIYGGLASGRLLLIGQPGAGKSAAAILLLLDALRYRAQAAPDVQVRIPVPVLFTLHGWDPGSGQSAADWMAGKLAETYPMFRGSAGSQAATDLLLAGRVAGFLDGLDEIPEGLRPGVLTALADAPFRVVLLSRTKEATDAAYGGPLVGAAAVELHPVAPADAATYLLQPLVDPPPAPWKTITDHLAAAADGRPRSAVAEALSTPLDLSLLRDIYGPTGRINELLGAYSPAGTVDELLDASRFPTAADIRNHLLDKAIAAAYTPRPGHPAPRYTVATADDTLRYLATQLTEHGTSDLAWWHIPTWTTHGSRMIRSAVMSALMNGLVGALALGFAGGFAHMLTGGLALGLTTGLVGALAVALRRDVPNTPTRITRPAYRRMWKKLGIGPWLYALAFVLVVGLATGLASGLLSGLVIGLVAGMIVIALGGFVRLAEVDGGSLGPADVWYQDRNIALGGWFTLLLVLLLLGLIPAFASALVNLFGSGLAFVLLAGLVLATVLWHMVDRRATHEGMWTSAAFDTAGALIHLAVRRKIPLRLIAFLEDAHSRHLLRTVGPVYQFRHATLQDRLARRTPEETPPASERPAKLPDPNPAVPPSPPPPSADAQEPDQISASRTSPW
jgi:hypothetical protein